MVTCPVTLYANVQTFGKKQQSTQLKINSIYSIKHFFGLTRVLQGPKSHTQNSNKANVKERTLLNKQVLLCCCTKCTSLWNIWKWCLKRDRRTKLLFTAVCQWLGLHWVCQALLTPTGGLTVSEEWMGIGWEKWEKGEGELRLVCKINKTFKMEKKEKEGELGM